MHARLALALAATLVGAPVRTRAAFFGGTTTTTSTTVPAGPSTCGDNTIEGDERCDGADLGGKTCADFTPTGGGVLACKADCTFDVTDCRRAFVATLMPANGGPGKNRCQLEFGTVGTTTDPHLRTKQICADGDTCDQDQRFNNSCTIRVLVCMDVPDDRIQGCNAARIIRLEVLQPKLNSDVNQKIASGVMAAANGAVQGQGHIDGNVVGFSPPVTSFSCGSSTVVVPLRGTSGHAKPGKVRIRARTSDNSGKTRAVANLVLVCNP